MGPDPMPSDSAPEAPIASDMTVRPRRRPRFWVILSLIVVLVAIIGIGIVIVVNVFTAKNELEAAVPLATKLESAIGHGDDAQSAKLASQFREHTRAASAAVSTPFYAIGEGIPGLGANLAAIKIVSVAADELADKAIVPASNLSIHRLKVSGGKIDLDALAQATPIIHTAAAAVDKASSQVGAIHPGSLLPQVADAVAKFDGQLGTIKTLTDGLDSSIDLMPTALGADGPRTYLLLFQNNAELRALGGNPAALLEVTVDEGQFAVAQQSNSADFDHQSNIPISSDVSAVYGDAIGKIIQNSTMVPDFSTVAGYAQKFWADRYGTKVDGVISFDPVALAGLLKATGPLKIDTGDTVTAANAVKLLLSTVYDRYRVPADQDAFFAKVASAMFQTVVSGKGSSFDVATQFSTSIADRRLILWSSDNGEESAIAKAGAAGTLPTDNTKATIVGAWINDFTFAKMGYYLDAKIAVQPSCASKPYSISETLTNSAPAGAGVLPPYVTGPIYLDGVIHTDVVFTGPVGSTFGTVTVGGATVQPAGSGMIDGRPVVRVSVTVAPGTSTTIGATFAAVDGSSPKVVVRSTPMVRGTSVTVTPCS
ncbi:MAG: DUF4012 domain-containing protein [Pseudolysinimonas sp.]